MNTFEKCMGLRFFAQKNPNKPAYKMAGSGQSISYLELENRANQVAQLLRQLGLKRGDSIALHLENDIHYFEICWGALRSGLYITLLNSHLNASELEYIIRDSDSLAVFTSIKLKDVTKSLIQKPHDNLYRLFLIGGNCDGFESYDTIVASMPTCPIDDESGGMYMLYTSGTTGRPKGVRRALPDKDSETMPIRYGLYFQNLFNYEQSSVQLISGHLYHIANINAAISPITLGGTVIVMERFIPTAVLEAIQKYRVTHSQWVPWHFSMLLMCPNYDSYDTSSLKAALHTSAPCPVDIKEKMINWWGPILYDDYGMSEGFGGCSITSQEWLQRKGSVGRAYIGKIHILDDEGNSLPVNQAGIVYFESDRKFEYYKNPEKTKSVRNSRGWATVGDIGYVDEEEYLYIVDRQNDIINVGGANVYPQEIEDTLLSHPMVSDSGVAGIPNESLGEEVKAFVKLKDESKATLELVKELKKFCRKNLSPEKVPTEIIFTKQLPRTPIGKIQRRKLKEAAFSNDWIPISEETDGSKGKVSVRQKVEEIWHKILNTDIEPSLCFFTNGGQSLDLVKMIYEVNTCFGVNLPLTFFFENPTIDRILNFIENKEKTYHENFLSTMDQDLSNINKMNFYSSLSFCQEKQNVASILVTGGNGFIGGHLLKEFLTKSDLYVYCLIRGESEQEAREKLNLSLKNIFPKIEQKHLQRLCIIPGDLSKKNLGLTPPLWQELSSKIDMIIHCGATVNHLYGYKQLREVNVLGTRELIHLAFATKIKRFYHISTLSAAVLNSQNILEEIFPKPEDTRPVESSGYAYTKFAAEQLVRNAKDHGLPVNLFRLGLIAGDSLSGFWPSQKDHFISLLKLCIDMHKAPQMNYFIDWLPVDWFVSDAVHFILKDNSFGKTIHYSNKNGILWNDLMEILNSMGYSIESIPYNQWRDNYLPQIPPEHSFFPLVPLYQKKNENHITKSEPLVQRNTSREYSKLSHDLIKKYITKNVIP